MPATDVPAPSAAATEARPRPAGGLPYERDVPWFADRRAFRIIVALLLLNALAVTSITWGPLVARAWQEWLAARKGAEQQARADAAKAAADAAKAAADAAGRVKARDAQLAGLKFAMVPGQVVYTEDFVEAARLARDGGVRYSAVPRSGNASYLSSAPLPHLPVAWDGSAELRAVTATLPSVNNFTPGARRPATVFLHERRTPSGAVRLVWVEVVANVELSSGSDDGVSYVTAESERLLVTRALEPATADRGARRLFQHELKVAQPSDRRVRVAAEGRRSKPGQDPILNPGDGLRLMAGAPDPADPARLTVPYELDGEAGTLSIRLGDDDRVRVDPDRGTTSVAQFNETSAWETWLPYATPATRPATRPASRPAGRGRRPG
ncbi:MAG: hypothetical protein JWO31_3994 [Phycisphaerales bacterium]|nr:hypothetical protein [Phycisphaerales bacterium]